MLGEDKSWGDAEDYCEMYGAHLASVTTSDVYEYMRSKISTDTWIGATNQTENGTWVWTDCSSFNSGAPSQGNGICAHLTADGQGSNDKDCRDKLAFVCSKDLCPGDSVMIDTSVTFYHTQYYHLGKGPVTHDAGNIETNLISNSRDPRMDGE